jgi:rhodanese-related sulfurtransferase
MPQTITLGYKEMCELAEREIETLAVEEAVKLYGRDDTVLVDIRDPRELQREGKVPGAFHCPRGMLDRSERLLFQTGVRPGQEIRVLLRRRHAFGFGGADRAPHGPQARRPYPRRLRRLEEGRRSGRRAGSRTRRGEEGLTAQSIKPVAGAHSQNSFAAAVPRPHFNA